ncbi:class I SAM-dependent methyltransferase [Variovorax sp. UC122_21]|uniref:class I SAM-dependent methyltransferase n=1 Tax=Variovorax sp. UC122_21 TaxID=3374554 RepID=UPI003758292D
MNIPAPVLDSMQRTLRSYEASARDYDAIVADHPPPEIEDALRRMVACMPAGGSVLEVGSGTGRDADFVESLGVIVRRTDATQAFLDLQAERGKQGALLNVVTDPLGGPFDAILAMAVLIHVDRAQIAPVLRKVFDALAPGGVFLAGHAHRRGRDQRRLPDRVLGPGPVRRAARGGRAATGLGAAVDRPRGRALGQLPGLPSARMKTTYTPR